MEGLQRDLPSLSDQEIRDLCYEYIQDYCCFGSKFIRDMIITDIKNQFIYHYRLESFAEKRESSDAIFPYYGQPVDGPENGPVPGLWDIPIGDPKWFTEEKRSAEIPHTSRVVTCLTCNGTKTVCCPRCLGTGMAQCPRCSGSGKDGEDTRCSVCDGTGKTSCWVCNTTGMVICKTCSGNGRVKHQMQLDVTWKIHPGDFFTNTYTLPKLLLLEAEGKEIIRQEGQTVQPIHFEHNTILNEGSAALIAKHKSSFSDQKILAQKYCDIIEPVISRNAYFAAPENMLLAMLTDERCDIRTLAARRIVNAMEIDPDGNCVRRFIIPVVNFRATDYVDLNDRQACNVTPPIILRHMSSHELLQMMQDDVPMDGRDFIKFPSHTQAVERIVKLVTEASRKRVGPQNRDGFITATLKSRKKMPQFESKKDYKK
ncbi:Protein SSUH2 [Araneus ventricosus]|uniref:Protein SSUH2 n=1 Tax=Araneus ventricosus TaxID=182803 RepID=A0A4Y2CTL4_ARAVE|nr:Protein SSUH2 [Araneus ventricosus]